MYSTSSPRLERAKSGGQPLASIQSHNARLNLYPRSQMPLRLFTSNHYRRRYPVPSKSLSRPMLPLEPEDLTVRKPARSTHRIHNISIRAKNRPPV